MRSSLSLFGTALGIIGALVDFGTGFYILSQSYVVMGPMGTASGYDPTGVAWGGGLVLLGTLLLTTVIVSEAGSRLRMATLGRLMALYGVAMLVVGVSMYVNITPMMAGGVLSGYAMLGVGVLMTANGVMMSRNTM